MGRGKLTMKLIEKEKARLITYQKRKKGLKKKAQEFATLCGVPTCMIIYGPKLNNRPTEIETWPTEREDFMHVVDLYKKKATFSRGVKTQNLFDFFADRQRKLVEKVAKLRKANLEAKFPSDWVDRFKNFSIDELKVLLARVDTNLEIARRKIVMLKGDQSGSESWALASCNSGVYQSCPEDIKMRQLPISSVNPQLAPCYNTPDHPAVQMLPFDVNPIDNPMMIMMMNGGELNQFGSTASSGMGYTQLQHPVYLDSLAAMLDNVMLNTTSRPLCYYGSAMQPLQSYEQCPVPVLPSVSSQTQMQNGSYFNQELHHEINQFLGLRAREEGCRNEV